MDREYQQLMRQVNELGAAQFTGKAKKDWQAREDLFLGRRVSEGLILLLAFVSSAMVNSSFLTDRDTKSFNAYADDVDTPRKWVSGGGETEAKYGEFAAYWCPLM